VEQGALRGAAALGGTRVGQIVNHNRYVRFGPGNIPKGRRFTCGPGQKVPTIRIGNGRPRWWNHFDLPVSSDALSWLLELRRSFGGADTGRWCFGSCLAEFTPPVRSSFSKGQLWDVALVLDQPEKIGCVLSLDEMQQSLFATRLFDGFDNMLRHSPTVRLLPE
jgi:hypothetical protein